MPFTPFHFGLGGAAHAVAPRRLSFLAFCAGNVLIDVEPLYYMVTGQDPLHRFMHTYVGATLAVAATVALFVGALKLSKLVRLPDVFGWQALKWTPVLVGAAAGCYSHIVLDSVMHADIHPWAPFSQANGLYLLVSIDRLHDLCVAAGVVGLLVLAARRWWPGRAR